MEQIGQLTEAITAASAAVGESKAANYQHYKAVSVQWHREHPHTFSIEVAVPC
jgi:hypothetical protein